MSFPDLPKPTEWFFRCGIACPVRARIEGEGVRAIRRRVLAPVKQLAESE